MVQDKKPLIKKDVVIIGAGAAGIMCAIEAGKRRRSVLVLEHMNKIGKKIRVSGGGRCNFTNTNLQPENYLSANPPSPALLLVISSALWIDTGL